jgi:UDP-glucuronate decarboxylase
MGSRDGYATIVTGCAGFIGANLVRRLLDEGAMVLGVDNLRTGSMGNLRSVLRDPNFVFVEIDVCDRNSMLSLVDILPKQLHELYHLAGIASPPAYMEYPQETLDVCYEGTKNALELAEFFRARFLLASTSEVYGKPEVSPQPESYHGNVNTWGNRSCYDEGKRVAETLCFVAEQRGADIRVARIFNTYGPYMQADDGRVVTNVLHALFTGDPIKIYGSGEQTRCFTYVDDLVDGLLLLMDTGMRGPTNVGSDSEITINEFVERTTALIEAEFPDIVVRSKIIHEDIDADDPRKRRPDCSKIGEVGWRATTPLEMGLKKMIGWAKTDAD